MGDKLAIPDLDELARFTKMVAVTDFVPAQFKGKAADVAVAMIYGHELGLSPMQSLQCIAVINKKPAIYGDGLMALCLSHPDCDSIDESFDSATMTATCTIKRKGHAPYTFSFSQEDAKKAKLWGKTGPWQEYPKRMLQMRARGFALRDKFADALKGVISSEEAADYQTAVSVTTPVAAPIRQQLMTHEPVQLPEYTEPEQDYVQSEYQQVEDVAEHEERQEQSAENGPVFHFGKYKDMPLSDRDIPQAYVEWYRNAIAKSVDDPAKAKYLTQNIAHLREIDSEIAWRETKDTETRGHIQPADANDDITW